jgi:hypothetical protein
VSELLTRQSIRTSIRASIIVQLATLAASYTAWVLDGCDPYMPFISDTDTNPASSPYFTLGFTLTGLSLSVIAWQMYKVRSEWIESNSLGTKPRMLNTFSAYLGFISGLFIIWIGYTPWDENLPLHLLQARVIFASSIAWAILSTMLVSEMQVNDMRFEQVFKPRRNRTVFTVVCCALMALNVVRFVGFGDTTSMELGHFEAYIDTVEICTDLTPAEMSLAALFEWGMVLGLIAVVHTGILEADLLSSHESEE